MSIPSQDFAKKFPKNMPEKEYSRLPGLDKNGLQAKITVWGAWLGEFYQKNVIFKDGIMSVTSSPNGIHFAEALEWPNGNSGTLSDNLFFRDVPPAVVTNSFDDDEDDDDLDEIPDDDTFEDEDTYEDFDEDFEDEFDEDYDDLDKIEEEDFDEEIEEDSDEIPDGFEEEFGDVDGEVKFLPEGADLSLAEEILLPEDDIIEEVVTEDFEDFSEDDDDVEEFDDI